MRISPQTCIADILPRGDLVVLMRSPSSATVAMRTNSASYGDGRLVKLTAPSRCVVSRSARHRLDAGDHLIDRLVDRHLFADHPVHGLRPHILVVENSELPILGELEGHGPGF